VRPLLIACLAGTWLATVTAGPARAAQADNGPATAPPAQTTTLGPGAQPAGQAPPAADAIVAEPEALGAPVVYRGEELWRVRASLGPFSAEDRARTVARRLDELVNDVSVKPEDITLEHTATASRVILRGRAIGVVTDEDAAGSGLRRHEMAELILADVRRVIIETRADFSGNAIVRSLLVALLATLALAGLWVVVTRGFRRVLRAVEQVAAQPPRQAGSDERLPLVARRQFAALTAPLLRLARLVVLGSLVLLWLEVVLAALPWTRPSARRLMDYVEEPITFVAHGLIESLPNFFYLAVIALVTRFALRLVRFLFREVERGALRLANFPAEWALPTYRLVRVLLVALAVVAAYPYIPGSSSPAFQGISVFLGLLISLSSSAAIGNIVSGTVLTYTGGFRLDDRVKIGDTVGDIIETSMLVTKIRTIKNVVVSIPNAVVLSSPMVNYSALARQDGLILHTGVTIGYDAPWRQVHDLLIAAARRTRSIVEAPAPFVLQTALNDFYVAYEINAYTHEPQRMVQIYSDLHANIQDAFNEAGVEIMSPHFGALRDGNRIAIPGDYVGAGYEAPAFRVKASAPDGESTPAGSGVLPRS
jgi:small-conductance mechanosensitive channel